MLSTCLVATPSAFYQSLAAAGARSRCRYSRGGEGFSLAQPVAQCC